MMDDHGNRRTRSAGNRQLAANHQARLKSAAFFDRDSTLIEDMEFSADPRKLKPLPGAMDALRRLQAAGYPLIIVTNQSGVARGIFDEPALRAFHEHMLRWFTERGVRITAIYYCPHYAEGKVPEYSVKCDCRKPEPGMLLRAACEHGLDLKKSWMIGDRPCDVGVGQAAGCRTIRIGRATDPSEPKADFEVADLVQAAEIVLASDAMAD